MALVHRCRFFEWVPEKIMCLSASSNDLLAVGRINGDIDIFSPFKDNFYSGKKITGQSNQCLRCVTWGKGEASHRLFSGVDIGYIYEWNLLTLQQEASTDSYGGWVTSLSVNRAGTKLAAGTAGGVTVFDLREGGLSFITKIPTKKLVTVVEFHPRDDIIFASTQKEICKFVPRGERRYEQIGSYKVDSLISSLLVLPDSTIVVGTNKGGVQMWNGKLGVQIAKFQEHQTSILALASNPSGDTVYASGGDPKIAMFKKAGPGFSKWIFSSHQRRHTHDVTSLVVMKNCIVSGSYDTQIMFYNETAFQPQAEKHDVHAVLPYPHSPIFDIAKNRTARLVLHRRQDGLELWRLGSTVDGAAMCHDIPVRSPPVKLLYMELTKDRHYLRTSAISPDGKYIACASAQAVKLFKLNYDQDTVSVEPVELPDLLIPQKISLTNTTLVLANHLFIQFLDLTTLSPSTEFHLARDDDDYTPAPINTLVTSEDGTYAAVGDLKNNIHVFDINNQTHVCTLPKMEAQHTASCFQPTTTVLAFADVTGRVHMYDFNKKAFTPWSQTPHNLPEVYARCVAADPIVGISFDPAQPSNIILWAPKFVASLKVSDQDATQRAAKRAKTETGTAKATHNGDCAPFKVFDQYSDLMCTGFVEEGLKGHQTGLVVVERPWLDVIPHLPDAFDLKLFGR